MNTSKNFFKAIRIADGKLSWNTKVIEPLGENTIEIRDREFDLSPEIQKALTNTNYNFKNMGDKDVVNFWNILENVDYNPREDSFSGRRKYIEKELSKRVDKIIHPTLSLPTTDTEIESSSDDLEGSSMKIIIPSIIIDIWTRLEVLLGLELSGHTDTLTEASSLLDEI